MREITSPTRRPPRATHSSESKRQPDSWTASASCSISPWYSSQLTYRSFMRLAERVVHHDRLLAVRAGGYQVERHAEHFRQATEIAARIGRQLFPLAHTEGRLAPAGKVLVHRFAAG